MVKEKKGDITRGKYAFAPALISTYKVDDDLSGFGFNETRQEGFYTPRVA